MQSGDDEYLMNETRGSLPQGHDTLLFLISRTGSFIWPVTQTQPPPKHPYTVLQRSNGSLISAGRGIPVRGGGVKGGCEEEGATLQLP